jgi:hypothetical protein
VIVSPGSILSLSFIFLLVLMLEVPFLRSNQRILIPETFSLITFAFPTAFVLRASGSIDVPMNGLIALSHSRSFT